MNLKAIKTLQTCFNVISATILTLKRRSSTKHVYVDVILTNLRRKMILKIILKMISRMISKMISMMTLNFEN